MDTNKDGFVDEKELYTWIHEHMQMLDAEEAHERFAEIDADHDGFVTWAEYKKDTFGEDADDMDVDDQVKFVFFVLLAFSCIYIYSSKSYVYFLLETLHCVIKMFSISNF